jgi:hypothetical protein
MSMAGCHQGNHLKAIADCEGNSARIDRMDDPSASTLRLDVAGQGTYVLPVLDVARHRGSYMARQATGSGPASGNDLYDEVLEQETQFALGHRDVLLEWAQYHMRSAELEPYRVAAT